MAYGQKKPGSSKGSGLLGKISGGVLLSHTVSHAVPSALKSLTSVFEMGTGVTSSPLPPEKLIANFDLTGAIWVDFFYRSQASLGLVFGLCKLFCGQAARPISTG